VLAQQSIAASLQQISSYFTSISSEDCASLDCGVYDIFVTSIASLATTAAANDELTDATAQQLSSALASITRNSTISACPQAFTVAATTIANIISAVNAANTGTNSSAPIGDQGGLSKGGAVTIIESLSGSLSSLISSVDNTAAGCEQFNGLTALVDATLAASSAGSIVGEATSGIATGSIIASTTRVVSSASNSGATLSSTGAIQFYFPDESLSDLECADIKIVEYAAPTALACRTDAASASTKTMTSEGVVVEDTSGTDLDRPVSTIVEADIVDCAGNIIDVANLTAPISFLVPLADDALLAPSSIVSVCVGDSFYLPNGGDVVAKTVVIEKEMECSFFNETTQQWSSDGCVVADNNVTQADGSRAVRCECTHLTEFAILLREKGRGDATSCNISPASVFGSILFLVFACLFSLLLAVAARQTYLTIWAFGLYKQKTMLAQHTLLCLICIFRIVVCVIYYELQHASVRADIEFKAVAAISGLPYIFMLWLFSLLVTNWASIYYAAKRNDLGNLSTLFKKLRPYFMASNVAGTLLFGSLFVMIALSTNAKERTNVTLAGSSIYAIVVFTLSIAFAFFGYGLLVQLSKDFKSSSAERICTVGMIFCACFVGEACIWLLSGVSPNTFFANFEVINSAFFTLDLVALVYILFVTKKTLKMGVDNKKKSQYKPPKMTAKKRSTAASTGARSRPNASATGSTGGGGSRGGPSSSRAASRRAARNAPRSIQSSNRALAKLSAPKKVVGDNDTDAAFSRVDDPDDPLYDGVATRPPVVADPSIQPSAFVNVEMFTTENANGETVIDIESVNREHAAIELYEEHSLEGASDELLSNPPGEFDHWFENLSVASSSVSPVSSLETLDFSDFDSVSDDLAFLDEASGSSDDSPETDAGSMDYDAWFGQRDWSLSSLSSWSWSSGESPDELHASSPSEIADADLELDALLAAAAEWL
jgi:hypothetical protein